MKCIVSTACVLSVLVAVSFAAPYFPAQFSASSNLQIGGSSGGAPSTSVSATGSATAGSSTSGGSLTDVLSSIDIPALLRSVNSIVKLVGVFCPPLSQVLDNVIQNVTSVAFRVFGRAILRNGLGGGGSSGSSGGGSRVNVVLPTYPPDDDDDYDEDDDTSASPGSDDNVDVRISPSTTTAATAQSDSAVNTTSTLYTSPANDNDNLAKRHVRVIREAKAEEEEEDQDGAESAPEPAEDLSNVDTDDADRNKRYSPFGAAGHGGGSGNFLFDIIRLVAGSGATEESDERAHGPGGVAEVDIAKSVEVGHHGEGIPGPITRLFVVANRGLANLVQDLILRLAQTSERLVNFKARLVTSLI
ncbi:DNA-directed RNA polymerase I subunit rpa1 isoform X4 [Zophobas morio]|uniref:DNA-directed RNA polymerase I subunit rpa1 isoform X4 n=1 Tax=Zophobas morio TaxID=2755281 RepID=UPI00308334D1